MDLIGLIILSLALGLAAWLFFLWSVKSGQYDDPEGPKYRMLDDDEPATKREARPTEETPQRGAGESPPSGGDRDRGPGPG